jgi:hypothetical protein
LFSGSFAFCSGILIFKLIYIFGVQKVILSILFIKRIMNKTFVLIFFLLPKMNYVFSQDMASPLEIEIKIRKEYELKLNKEHFALDANNYQYEIKGDSVNEKRFDIEIAIQNNSAKPIFIWLMSCSWENNFLVNNNYIFIEGNECNKNSPKIVEIKPGTTKFYYTTLKQSIKFNHPCKNCVYGKQVETTKLGLIIINDIFKREYTDYFMFMDDKSRWNIIWSNSLNLLGKQPETKTIEIWEN